ncbi:MAG: hypothetical protein V4590_13145 [Bacteroidota bacterium]
MLNAETPTIEVFKTSIETIQSAQAVIQQLNNLFPLLRITIDLDDCDRILRIEGTLVAVHTIIENVNLLGHSCEMLE